MSSAARLYRHAAAGFVVLAALLALGVEGAGASSTLVAYNLYPLVSDGTAVTAPLADPSLVNGWGLTAGTSYTMVVGEQQGEQLDALHGRRLEERDRRLGAGRPDRHRRQPEHHRLLDQPERHERCGPLPLRHGRRSDPRLDADRQCDDAVVAVDNSSKGAVYDGLAATNDRLYAADFHNAQIDSFDASFNPLSLRSRIRTSRRAGAPFNIQALGGNLFVTYASRTARRPSPSRAAGSVRGRVQPRRGADHARGFEGLEERAAERAVGPCDGAFELRRLQRRPARRQLRQRADRRLPAEDAAKYVYKGQVRVASGAPIVLDGLWAIAFGNGSSAGPTNNLYFVSGPSGGAHGLFGFIAVG